MCNIYIRWYKWLPRICNKWFILFKRKLCVVVIGLSSYFLNYRYQKDSWVISVNSNLSHFFCFIRLKCSVIFYRLSQKTLINDHTTLHTGYQRQIQLTCFRPITVCEDKITVGCRENLVCAWSNTWQYAEWHMHRVTKESDSQPVAGRRDNRGAQGVGSGEELTPPQPTRGLGSVVSSPSGVQGRADDEFGWILTLRKCFGGTQNTLCL